MAAAVSSSPSVPAGPPGAPAGNIPPRTGDQGPLAEVILPARRGSSGCHRDEGTEGSQQPLSGTGRPGSFSGSPYTALPGRRPRLPCGGGRSPREQPPALCWRRRGAWQSRPCVCAPTVRCQKQKLPTLPERFAIAYLATCPVT